MTEDRKIITTLKKAKTRLDNVIRMTEERKRADRRKASLDLLYVH